MTESEAMGLGITAGIIPALWFGAYMFHIVQFPVNPFTTWWAIPAIITIITNTILIPIIFGIAAAIIWEHKHA